MKIFLIAPDGCNCQNKLFIVGYVKEETNQVNSAKICKSSPPQNAIWWFCRMVSRSFLAISSQFSWVKKYTSMTFKFSLIKKKIDYIFGYDYLTFISSINLKWKWYGFKAKIFHIEPTNAESRWLNVTCSIHLQPCPIQEGFFNKVKEDSIFSVEKFFQKFRKMFSLKRFL